MTDFNGQFQLNPRSMIPKLAALNVQRRCCKVPIIISEIRWDDAQIQQSSSRRATYDMHHFS